MVKNEHAPMRACAGLLLLLAVFSARAEYLLVPEQGTLVSGGTIAVTLFVPNDSAQELAVALPTRLTLRTRGVAAAPDVILKPAQSQPMQIKIAPRAFARVRYSGTLPRDLVGNLVLEPVDFSGPTLGVTAERSESLPANAALVAPADTAPAAADAKPADNKTDAASVAIGTSDRDRARFASSFSPYEPNYFSLSPNSSLNAKFQVSVKFRLFNEDTQTSFLEKLYLAYSQTSIWEIGSSSAPFYDTSYRPSVFFLDEDVSQWPFRKWSRLGFQAGVEHESNGKDGVASRSINTAYVRPTFTLPFADAYFVSVSPKIYSYIQKETKDIAYYRGYSDLLVKIGETEGVQLATTLRKGTGDAPYSAEFDLSIPLRTPMLGNLGGYLHLQYFNGWGESLLDYNRRVPSHFRIGLMITR
ncbi:MAG: phospholipase A [Betaproteobacteria bacterium]